MGVGKWVELLGRLMWIDMNSLNSGIGVDVMLDIYEFELVKVGGVGGGGFQKEF